MRLTHDLLPQWRVRTTVEDFLRVPDFLRPTSLERRVPHQLCINMIVWYDIFFPSYEAGETLKC